MEVYELVAPGTLLKHMCEAQRAICEEFINAEGVDTFNRVVNLVNDVSNVQRPTKKIRILEDQVFIQAVYKIVLLAQGTRKDASRAAEFGFNMFFGKNQRQQVGDLSILHPQIIQQSYMQPELVNYVVGLEWSGSQMLKEL